MNLEQQVCSLDLAKRLKELGVKQESYFQWKEIIDNHEHAEPWVFHAEIEVKDTKGHYKDKNDKWEERVYSAFTVAELGEMLPCKVDEYQWRGNKTAKDNAFEVKYRRRKANRTEMLRIERSDTEADARAKMLIYLIENKLLTP